MFNGCALCVYPAVNKAYKTLENEEGLKRCAAIVEEARSRTTEMVTVASFSAVYFAGHGDALTRAQVSKWVCHVHTDTNKRKPLVTSFHV